MRMPSVMLPCLDSLRRVFLLHANESSQASKHYSIHVTEGLWEILRRSRFAPIYGWPLLRFRDGIRRGDIASLWSGHCTLKNVITCDAHGIANGCNF